MKLQNLRLFSLAAGLLAACVATGNLQAATATIDGLDVRDNGLFGAQPGGGGAHATNATGVTLNGAAFPGARLFANPLELTLTYNNLDLDGDTTANDAVTFTIRWEQADFDNDGFDGNALGIFNQGVDTGFGNLNDLLVSVINVSGTTTDSGDAIVFDGFTGASIGSGVGGGSALNTTVEVNGIPASIVIPDDGAFRFGEDQVNFAPSQTVSFDNAVVAAGSVVARNYDLQFSSVTIPEPSSLAILGLGAVGFAARRRR